MPARKRVTAADVARSLGISRATVGFVLNNTPGQTISEPTRRRVLDEAARLGYRPHRAAAALASGRTRIILLVLPDWPMEHALQSHVDEASRVLEEAGYSLVTTTRRPGRAARPLWETLEPDVVVAMTAFSEDEVASLERARIRAVIPGASTLSPTDEGAEDLELHFAEGPRLQVETLLARGRRRLAFAALGEPRLAELVAAREALARRTIEGAPNAELVDSRPFSPEDDRASHEELVRSWVAKGVDGVVAYNDVSAALVAGAALRTGIRIPEQLAIIGHDDAPLASLSVPGITTIHVDNRGLGRFLAQLALREAGEDVGEIREPESVIRLIDRETA